MITISFSSIILVLLIIVLSATRDAENEVSETARLQQTAKRDEGQCIMYICVYIYIYIYVYNPHPWLENPPHHFSSLYAKPN